MRRHLHVRQRVEKRALFINSSEYIHVLRQCLRRSLRCGVIVVGKLACDVLGVLFGI
jgi:hypothetical protein